MANAARFRQSAILDLLSRDGFVDIAGLQRELGCSEATVRRDLEQMQRAGLLRRTHGGAVAESPHELPFAAKLREMAPAKGQIAARAATLVEDGHAVGFTGGTTTFEVARALISRTGLTAVTNAVNIAMELAASDIRVIVIGGELRGQTYELVGPLAEPLLEQIHLDIAFVGVDGLSVGGGLTTHNPTEARTNRVLLSRAARVVVVTDHTKLGRKTFAQIAPLEGGQVLITDDDAPPALVEEIRAAGMEVILVDAAAHGLNAAVRAG